MNTMFDRRELRKIVAGGAVGLAVPLSAIASLAQESPPLPGTQRAALFMNTATISRLSADKTRPTITDPAAVAGLSMAPRGLVLVTGPTGSGKSTTLAAMVDHRNRRAPGHIVTIEDPIEFVHGDHQSLVSQREVGTDCDTEEGVREAACDRTYTVNKVKGANSKA